MAQSRGMQWVSYSILNLVINFDSDKAVVGAGLNSGVYCIL